MKKIATALAVALVLSGCAVLPKGQCVPGTPGCLRVISIPEKPVKA